MFSYFSSTKKSQTLKLYFTIVSIFKDIYIAYIDKVCYLQIIYKTINRTQQEIPRISTELITVFSMLQLVK